MSYEAHEGYRYGCRCEVCEDKRGQDPAIALFRAIDSEMAARTIDAPAGPIVEFTAEEDSLTPHLP